MPTPEYFTFAFDDTRGSGPPVVLLHAFPLSHAMWRPQADALADSYRVIRPDFPGFGGSPLPPDGWTFESVAVALDVFLTTLGITGPVVLGGLSMGGYAAFAAAWVIPHRVRALILADTKSEPDDAAGKAGRDEMIAAIPDVGVAGVVEKLLPKLLGETTRRDRPAVVEEVRWLATEQTPEGVAAGLAALRDRADSTPRLGNIAVPTLILVGEEDAITPPAGAEKLAARIPGAKLVTLPGVGHLANLEDPAAFTAAVRAFLDGLA